MEQGKKYSFYQLLKEKDVLIPRIQRDYVQGRKNQKIRSNRKTLVGLLVDSLKKKQTLMLNFVYGYKDIVQGRERFIPIDGQQRLTTLLLFHAYVFARVGKQEDFIKLKKSFYYETRFTTKRFLDKLFEEENIKNFQLDRDTAKEEILKERVRLIKEIEKCEVRADKKGAKHNKEALKEYHEKQILISEKIKNSIWFSSAWLNDITIVSCLEMLDEIEDSFLGVSGFEDAYKLLTSNDCPISFMLLEIEGLGKPSELYIKMNARGKQLTDFENLKAELYEYLEEQKSSFYDEDADFVKKFKAKMDGDWLGYVWKLYKNNDKAAEKADDFYRELIHAVFTTRIMLEGQKKEEEGQKQTTQKEKKREIKEDPVYVKEDAFKQVTNYDLEKYKELVLVLGKENEKVLLECIKDLYYTLECLNKQGDALLFADLMENTQYSWTYPARTLLFAITNYARQKSKELDNSNEFKKYYRVMRNIIYNSIIDKYGLFYTSCKTVSDFDCKMTGLHDLKRGFRDRAIDEENLKLQLMDCSSKLETLILQAETIKYFNAEIYFTLRLLDGKAFPLTIPTALNIKGIDESLYENIVAKINAIFKDWESGKGFNNLLHRLLLTYEDYSIEINNNIHTLYYNDNKHHDYDWRGFLREEKQFDIFKKMFEDFKNSNKNFADFAREKINAYYNISNQFIYQLIKEEYLFEYIKSYSRYWKDSRGRYLLMSSSKRTTYAEYKSYAVYCYFWHAFEEKKGHPWNEFNKSERDEFNKKFIYKYGNGSDENSLESDAYLIIKRGKKEYLVKYDADKGCFEEVQTVEGNPIKTVEEMIKFLENKGITV